MKFCKIFFIYILIAYPITAKVSEASKWLKTEIDKIIIAYQSENLPNENRFLMIEQTINNNFAGTAIGKFVASKGLENANKETEKVFIKLFKRHLALNIASLMQGYSDQKYSLINSRYDEKSKVNLIDMEIYSESSTFQVTWRLKKAKGRYFVIDLIVSDISLVVTKRSEFNSMLKNVEYNLEKFNRILEDKNITSYNKLIN